MPPPPNFELDALRYLTRIYRTTSGGTVFSSNYAETAAFDYFSDTAVANDAMYFCTGSTGDFHPNGISFNVGTAMAGADIVLVWEYYTTSNTWVALSDVVDNTSGFTVTGVNTVSWTMPSNAKRASVNGFSGNAVRCRIDSLTSISEGGANQTDNVTCLSWGITVRGFSEETPCEAMDIYDADVVGGWGIFQKLGDNLFYCTQNLFIGDEDTATYCNFSNIGFVIDGHFCVTDNAVMTFGELIDIDRTSTRYGCFGYNTGSALPYNNFYNVKVRGDAYGYHSVFYSWRNDTNFTDLINCNIDCTNLGGRGGIFDRINFYRPSSNPLSPDADTSYNDISVKDCSAAVRYWNQNQTSTGTKIIGRNILYAVSFAGGTASATVIVNLVDCDLDSWAIYWWTTNVVNNKIYRKYTVNITVVDINNNPIENATVCIRDVNGDIVFTATTDSNGQIVEQTIISHMYTWASGSAPGVTTDTDYNPFTLTIRKDGYETYKIMSTIEAPILTTQKIKNSVSAGRDEMGAEFK